MRRLTIRTFLILIVTATVLIGFAFSSYYTYTKALSINKDLMEAHLKYISQSFSSEISGWLAAKRNEMIVIANSPTLLTGDEKAIIDYFKIEEKRRNLGMRNIVLIY